MPEAWGFLGQRPLLLSCVGATLLGITGVLFRLSHATPSTATAFRCVYALPVLWGLSRYESRHGEPWVGSRPIAWAAGAMLAVDLVIWQRSVELVGAGLATVLGNTQLVFVVLVSVLLFGERLTGRLAFAIGAMLVGVVLIGGVLDANPYGAHPVQGSALAVAAGSLYAGYILLVRRASGEQASVGPLLHATLAAALTALALGAVVGQLDLRPSWPMHGWLLLLALLTQVVAWLLLTMPMRRLPASATSVALTLQPVAGVVWGALILTERPSPLQMLGVTVVIGGFAVAVCVRATTAQVPVRAYSEEHA